jgi:dipeptidyl aminopeptidase/acylaminoacyl peptidase
MPSPCGLGLATSVCASIVCAALSSTALAAQPTHPFSVDDLVRLNRLSEPALSPDEKHIVFTMRETDMEADRGRTDLWLLDVTSTTPSQPKRLTTHPDNDSSAQWSIHGSHIYFLSSRSGSQQVWRLPLNGGEAQRVTDLPLDVTTFKLSPNNSQLAITLDVFPDCAADLKCTTKRSGEQQSSKAKGMVFDRLFVRHWDTWSDGTQTHLFVMPLIDGLATGTPRDLSSSLDADVPSKPFGDASEYTFSPDSSKIVFSARVKGKSEAWSTNFDLFEVAVAGGAVKNLTAANLAWDAQPLFSDDGTWLAYRAMERAGFEADRFHIVLLNRKTGEQRALTKNWDRSVDAMEFARDGKSLIAVTDHLGQHVLWSIDLKTGAPKQVTESGHVDAFTVGSRALYFALATLQAPADLFTVGTSGGKSRQITEINAEKLGSARMGSAEQFTFVGANNETVYAHIVKPVDFDANKKYPVAFFVHGGPQSSFGNAWSYRWNPNTYAGAGYAFIAIDFHGSPGYGQKFTDSISQDWGGKPLTDLQKGLAHALQKYPWLNADRVCALGASYGGFMVNWIAGNWNEPFKCIVSHAGIADSRMMSYSTEELWFDEWEHGATQYESPEKYEKFNPINHVAKWRVPMLIIAGQKDYRIPYTQGLAAFTVLQRRGIPSRFLVFPNENHWVLKPANSVQWHREVQGWLDKYLKGN